MSRISRLLLMFLALTGTVPFSGCYTVISHTAYRDALFQRWPEESVTVFEGGSPSDEIEGEVAESEDTGERELEGLRYEGVAKSIAEDEYIEESGEPDVTEETIVISEGDTVTTITHHYYHYPSFTYRHGWYDPWWYDPYWDICLRPWYVYYPRYYAWDMFYYDPWYWDTWYWGPGVCYYPYHSYYSWYYNYDSGYWWAWQDRGGGGGGGRDVAYGPKKLRPDRLEGFGVGGRRPGGYIVTKRAGEGESVTSYDETAKKRSSSRDGMGTNYGNRRTEREAGALEGKAGKTTESRETTVVKRTAARQKTSGKVTSNKVYQTAKTSNTSRHSGDQKTSRVAKNYSLQASTKKTSKSALVLMPPREGSDQKKVTPNTLRQKTTLVSTGRYPATSQTGKIVKTLRPSPTRQSTAKEAIRSISYSRRSVPATGSQVSKPSQSSPAVSSHSVSRPASGSSHSSVRSSPPSASRSSSRPTGSAPKSAPSQSSSSSQSNQSRGRGR